MFDICLFLFSQCCCKYSIFRHSILGSCGVSEVNKSLIRSGCPVWDKSRVVLSRTDFIDASHVILPQVIDSELF